MAVAAWKQACASCTAWDNEIAWSAAFAPRPYGTSAQAAACHPPAGKRNFPPDSHWRRKPKINMIVKLKGKFYQKRVWILNRAFMRTAATRFAGCGVWRYVWKSFRLSPLVKRAFLHHYLRKYISSLTDFFHSSSPVHHIIIYSHSVYKFLHRSKPCGATGVFPKSRDFT